MSHTFFDQYNDHDRQAVASGNCYQTKELAQKAFERQLAIVRVNNRIDELNDEWEMEWNGCGGGRIIFYAHDSERFDTIWFDSYQCCTIVNLCKTDVAEQIIKEMESDLKLIFNIT